jgi:hypothetical protein
MNGFTDVSDLLTLNAAYSQGASWGDYDNDGYLDLYVCNYNNEVHGNWLFHNNAGNSFTEVAAAMGVKDGFNSAFQSIWIDINQDGWLDLYVVNDRWDVNKLFINTGSSFTSQYTGLDVAMNSMCNIAADHDNDGDFDFYITNTAQGNFLMQNNDGFFENIANEAGVSVNAAGAWASLWFDIELDGDDDLYVCTDENTGINDINYLFTNEGNGSYVAPYIHGMINDNFKSYVAAKGDFNNDGHWDFVTCNYDPWSFKIWYGNAISYGNYIKLGLQGVVSNADAVGVTVKVYHQGHLNMITTFCGENLYSQDSQYEIIGLGQSAVIDSIIAIWPSGWVDKYFNCPVNQFRTLIEGETFTCHIESSNGNSLCWNGGETLLTTGNYPQVVWNNSFSQNALLVNQPGVCSVQVTNQWGLLAQSEIVILQSDSIVFNFDVQHNSCFELCDGAISLANDDLLQSITWSNGDQNINLGNVCQGEYAYLASDVNNCTTQGVLHVTQPDILLAQMEYNPLVCFGDSALAQLTITGGVGEYQIQSVPSFNQYLHAGNYTFYITDENECNTVLETTIVEPEPIILASNVGMVCPNGFFEVQLEIAGGTGNYMVDWHGANPNELYEGIYECTITDSALCISQNYFQVIEYEAIEASALVENVNDLGQGSIFLEVYGGTPPYNYAWSDGSFSNPLYTSNQGTYHCVISDSNNCTYTLTDVNVLDETTSVIEVPFDIQIITHANGIQIMGIGNVLMHVFDLSGKVLESKAISVPYSLDFHQWPAGCYIITCNSHAFKYCAIEK